MSAMNRLARNGALEYVDQHGAACYVSSQSAKTRRCRVALIHVAYVVPAGQRFRVARIVSVPAAEFRSAYRATGARFTPWGQELVRQAAV